MMIEETSLDVKLYSLNVRGLRDKVKRRCMFDWLRNTQYDIFILQETHSTTEVEKYWSSEWGSKCYFSYGK